MLAILNAREHLREILPQDIMLLRGVDVPSSQECLASPLVAMTYQHPVQPDTTTRDASEA